MAEHKPAAKRTKAAKQTRKSTRLQLLTESEIGVQPAQDLRALWKFAVVSLKHKAARKDVLSTSTIFVAAVDWGLQSDADPIAPAAIVQLAQTIESLNKDGYARLREEFFEDATTVPVFPGGVAVISPSDRMSTSVQRAMGSGSDQARSEDRPMTATDLMQGLFGTKSGTGFASARFVQRLQSLEIDPAQVIEALKPIEPENERKTKTSDGDGTDATAEIQERHQTELSSDRAETTRDLLGRAPLAFTLARHVNRIWTEQNKPTTADGKQAPDEAAFILHIDSPWGGGKTTFANYLSRILNPKAYGLDPKTAGKGGDTLFTDLAMEDERSWPKAYADRKWITVTFNAWQNQHVSPPWWNFYESIRRQCLGALPFRKRMKDWFKEWKWRIWSPDFQRTLFVVAVVLAVAWPLMSLGVLEPAGKAAAPQKVETGQSTVTNTQPEPAAKTQPEPAPNAQPEPAVNTQPEPAAKDQPETPAGNDTLNTILVLLLTGGSGFALLKSFKSGLSKIVDSAATSVDPGTLGEADPIRRFRERFAKAMEDYKEPVLVVVDDLDRCEPDYVVELVRGMMTIFRSPRVVFALLGDKSWIETSFANVHEDMAAAHTDDEISFGERFAEKAIQLSFILPEPDEASREAYIDHLLLGEDAEKAPIANAPSGHDGADAPGASTLSEAKLAELRVKAERFQEQTRGKLRATGSGEDRNKVTDEQLRAAKTEFAASEDVYRAVKTMINREAALEAAISEHTDKEIRHGVSALKGDLPDNPRRIKRIINMIAAYQAGAQTVHAVKPLSDQWRQLVLWIILMSEHPEAWRILSANPDFADLIIDDKTVKPARGPKSDADGPSRSDLFATVSRERIARLIKGKSFKDANVRIDTKAVGWLSRLTPIA